MNPKDPTMPARCLLLLSLLAPFAPAALADEPAKDVPSFALEVPVVKTGKPVLEFNGKDLSGFYTWSREHKREDPNKVFTVQDGMIRISGQEYGAITTNDEFDNYHLITEWKWGRKTWPPRVDKSRDSGILLHCVGEDGAAGGIWMESIECQIIEGGCGDLLMVGGKGKPSLTCEVRIGPDKQFYYEKGAIPITRDAGRYNWWGRDPAWKDVLGVRGSRDVEKPTGEWNRIEVVCQGGTITNIVNGFVVNVGTKSSVMRGKLQFQSEGAEIFFRKIEVRPLLK